MVNTYSGKSPRNARIKIDYTGQAPSVNFTYPRKDGYVGSMLHELFLAWFIILYFSYLIFTIGAGYDITSTYNFTSNDTSINETEIKELQNETIPLCNGLKDWLEVTKDNRTFKERLTMELLGLWMNFKYFLYGMLIILVPPILINKIFKKKMAEWFPVWQGYRAKKKYVQFTNKDIKTSRINNKKEIYVKIPYFENVILNYEATKDFSKYLDSMEIKEHNFKTFEKPKENSTKKKRKKKRKKVKKQNEWYWSAKFYFSHIPQNGKLDVIFK